MKTQDDALVMIHGIQYKFGRHGFIYAWNGDEWVKSTQSEEVILTAWKSRYNSLPSLKYPDWTMNDLVISGTWKRALLKEAVL